MGAKAEWLAARDRVDQLNASLASPVFGKAEVYRREQIAARAYIADLERSKIPVEKYSAAIEEIYRLRIALAYIARVGTVALGYKTMAKNARANISTLVQRAEWGARGEVAAATEGINQPKTYLRMVGADECLTNHQWEAQRGL